MNEGNLGSFFEKEEAPPNPISKLIPSMQDHLEAKMGKKTGKPSVEKIPVKTIELSISSEEEDFNPRDTRGGGMPALAPKGGLLIDFDDF